MPSRRGQGEGTVFQRHTNACARVNGAKTCRCRWAAQLDMGWSGGRRRRPTRSGFATKAAAQTALDEMRLSRNAGVVPTAGTVGDWLDYWLEKIVDPSDLKPSSKTYYAMNVRQWLIPYVGRVPLQKLGPEHVRDLHDAMRKAGKSPTTIRNAHATLRRALGAALVERRVLVNWAREVGGPSAADNPSPVLSIKDAGAVFVTASSLGPRELARVHVAVLCGLRQGEALALRWEDVRDGRLHVDWSAARVDGVRVRQRPKTARSRRVVPLSPAARLSLDAWRHASGGRGYVFPGWTGTESIEDAARDSKAWHAILKQAGVRPVKLHGARATCATFLQAQGVPERVIADILGQADVRVLMEHYLHSTPEQREDALASVDGLLASAHRSLAATSDASVSARGDTSPGTAA